MNKQIDLWTKMYESTLDEGAFNRTNKTVTDIINKLKDENVNGSIVKIVLDGKFYDIKDIYSIEDDNTSTYICIEGESKK